MPSQGARVFVSYSHRDEIFKDELVAHLDVLQRSGHLSVWQDRKIDGGAHWQKEIEEQINSCNIALLLVSEHFLRSDFITSVELKRLIERERLHGIRVIPIIVRPCPWKYNTTIGQRSALPRDGRAVITFPEADGQRNSVWTEIAEKLVGVAPLEDRNVVEEIYRSHARAAEFADVTPPALQKDTKQVLTLLFCGLQTPAAHVSDLSLAHREQLDGMYRGIIAAAVKKDGSGRVLRSVPDGILAAFDNPSSGVAAALGIQRFVHEARLLEAHAKQVELRMGLHMGELKVQELDQVSAHHAVTAFELMNAADDNQILLSSSIHDNTYGANFDVPREHLRWANHGDLLLAGAGIREIHEVTNIQVRAPLAPLAMLSKSSFAAARKLEFSGIRILHRVTQGGLAPVYKAIARDGSSDVPVAVKVLTGDQGEHGNLRAKFIQEARAVQRLKHDGIVRIREVRNETTPPYIVMDWVEGKPLDEFAKELSLQEKLRLLIETCSIVEFAHGLGVIHGDLKPSNIIVNTHTKRPVVIDFGLSYSERDDPKATERSTRPAQGTPIYMAPEQIDGKHPINQATDVYSLGIIIYELFVGKPPFKYPTVQQLRGAHLHEDPPLPVLENRDVPEPIQRICLKGIEKSPADRYATIAELKADLGAVSEGKPVKVRPRVYNNLIETRATNHLNAISEWFDRSLITEREHIGLTHAYVRLIRSGIQAVSESRLMHLPILFLYLSGIMLLAGTAMLLMDHGGIFGEDGWLIRTLMGLFPTILCIALWYAMLRRGRYRSALVLSLLTIVTMPFALNNAFFEITKGLKGEVTSFGFLGDVLFRGSMQDNPGSSIFKYANWQLTIAALIASLWANYQSKRSETFSTACLSALWLGLAYVAALDVLGLLHLSRNEHRATLGLLLLPLVAIALLRGTYLNQVENRSRQVIPYFVIGMLALLTSTTLVSLYGPDNFHFRQERKALQQKLDAVEALDSQIEELGAGNEELSGKIEPLNGKTERLKAELQKAQRAESAARAAMTAPNPTVNQTKSKPGEPEAAADPQLVVAAAAAKQTLEKSRKTLMQHNAMVAKLQAEADKLDEQLSAKRSEKEKLEKTAGGKRDLNNQEQTLIGFMFFLSGLLYAWLSRLLRRRSPVHGSSSYLVLLQISVIFGVGGLIWAAQNWPGSWSQFLIPFLGQEVAAPDFLALVLSVVALWRASQVQSYGTMILGLIGATISVWHIEMRFEGSASWSILLLFAGLIALCALAWRFFTQKGAEDIDDVGERLMQRTYALARTQVQQTPSMSAVKRPEKPLTDPSPAPAPAE
jgi:serine/threonine protein kinase/class 3 adenylate cyclase